MICFQNFRVLCGITVVNVCNFGEPIPWLYRVDGLIQGKCGRFVVCNKFLAAADYPEIPFVRDILDNPDVIYPGQELRIPKRQGPEVYTVQSGDCLSKIAKEFYGQTMKYNRIFEANMEVLENASVIRPGQKLRIPSLQMTH